MIPLFVDIAKSPASEDKLGLNQTYIWLFCKSVPEEIKEKDVLYINKNLQLYVEHITTMDDKVFLGYCITCRYMNNNVTDYIPSYTLAGEQYLYKK